MSNERKSLHQFIIHHSSFIIQKMVTIAKIYTDFPEKFGLPRQAGLVPGLCGKILFEKPYRDVNAVRGLDGYSHLWIIWKFDGFNRSDGKFSPTVRPPRLGGNRRMGVFATRSPNRPNPIALSCVKIEKIDTGCADAPIIYVSGIDMVSESEIFDIKPYLPICDCKADAVGGFSDEMAGKALKTEIPQQIREKYGEEYSALLEEILSGDIRPAYQPEGREYTFSCGGNSVTFIVENDTCRVTKIAPEEQNRQK